MAQGVIAKRPPAEAARRTERPPQPAVRTAGSPGVADRQPPDGGGPMDPMCLAYRSFADRPESVLDPSERLNLLRHPVTCKECLRFALEGLEAELAAGPAAVSEQ